LWRGQGLGVVEDESERERERERVEEGGYREGVYARV